LIGDESDQPAMKRRQVLRIAAAAGAWLALSGHSPYRQWDVYRKVRLVILVSAAQPEAVKLGGAVAALYAKRLPQSRATIARARDTNDLARLVASKQLEIALMSEPDAHALLMGEAPFADNGKVALRSLAQLGDYVMVCRDDLPDASAYMLVEATVDHWKEIDAGLVRSAHSPRPRADTRLPLHPGAAQFYQEHE
jgi:TRAP-type uncharacterized transport system substrate-binding protein